MSINIQELKKVITTVVEKYLKDNKDNFRSFFSWHGMEGKYRAEKIIKYLNEMDDSNKLLIGLAIFYNDTSSTLLTDLKGAMIQKGPEILNIKESEFNNMISNSPNDTVEGMWEGPNENSPKEELIRDKIIEEVKEIFKFKGNELRSKINDINVKLNDQNTTAANLKVKNIGANGNDMEMAEMKKSNPKASGT